MTSVVLFDVTVGLFEDFLVLDVIFEVQGATETLLDFAASGNG